MIQKKGCQHIIDDVVGYGLYCVKCGQSFKRRI